MDDIHQALLTAFLLPLALGLAAAAGLLFKDWLARSRAR